MTRDARRFRGLAMPPLPLSLSRMLSCGGTPPPPYSRLPAISTPLGGALTWDPVSGPVPHATPSLAALHVVAYNAAHGQPDELIAERGVGDLHPLRARILCVSETVRLAPNDEPGLSTFHERRLLAEARALLEAQRKAEDPAQ